MKGTTDVLRDLRKTQKGSSHKQGPRDEDLSFSAHPGHSSLSILEKSCGTLVPKRDSLGNSNLTNGVKLLPEHGLHVEWSQEKPESASGIGGVTQPIGVVYVPVGLAGCNGVIRFTVVEQDVPSLLPVGITRTLHGHSCRPI